jgi:hypothetical protein
MLLAALLSVLLGLLGAQRAVAVGPSGSDECHIQDDDCDGAIDEDSGAASDDDDGDGLVDEDTGTLLDDDDGDGAIDEDPPGDANGDLNPDDDLDGAIDEDPADDDGDGAIDEDVADDDGDGSVDEDPPGDAADDPEENQAVCADGQDVNGIKVYADSGGAEACSDASETGPEGRIIVSSDQGGYVAADGDADNPEPANGYARLDSDGLHCGDESNEDSTQADQTQNTQEDCQPDES